MSVSFAFLDGDVQAFSRGTGIRPRSPVSKSGGRTGLHGWQRMKAETLNAKMVLSGFYTQFLTAAQHGVNVAQKIQTLLIDDIEGSEATETVTFGLCA